MKSTILKRVLCLTTLGCSIALASSASVADTYEVTVTNLTKGQSFTPRLAITHTAGKVFDLGQPALPELATIAESGDVAPMMTLLSSAGSVITGTAVGAGLLDPGKSQTIMIEGTPGTLFTLLSMLIPTNDAFIGINAVMLPMTGSASYHATVYDAGSEPNDELCVNIPGPVCGGEGASPNASGEGYVYVHSGIHGVGGLAAATYDWNNPAALVTISKK